MATHKKTAKKIYEGGGHLSKNRLTTVISIIIIAVALIIILTTLVNDKTTDTDILVTVNGEAITRQELDTQWNALPAQAKTQVSREQIFGELIQERLLLQEAQAKGILVTSAEVESFVSLQLAQSGATLEQFKQVLAAQQTSYEQIEQIYQKQLLIAKLFDQIVSETNITVSEEDIQAFYEANEAQFAQEEQVTVRHILIQEDALINQTADERLELIFDSLNETNGGSFCDLVANYTGDRASVATCGEYTFGKGVMVPEFEEKSFELDIGELGVANSQFGFHVIEKLNATPEQQLELDDTTADGQTTVRSLIITQLEQEAARMVFDKYIDTLQETAEIVFSEGVALPPQFSEE